MAGVMAIGAAACDMGGGDAGDADLSVERLSATMPDPVNPLAIKTMVAFHTMAQPPGPIDNHFYCVHSGRWRL